MKEEHTSQDFVEHLPEHSKYADESGMLDKVKYEIAGDDFREGLTAVISVKVMEPQFEVRLKLN